jgi:hypothetical protein
MLSGKGQLLPPDDSSIAKMAPAGAIFEAGCGLVGLSTTVLVHLRMIFSENRFPLFGIMR